MRIRKYWPCYLTVFFIVVGLKCFYNNAGSDELLWILAPTARWVRGMSGLHFIYKPGIGYINHTFRFIIAASCAGVRFLIICFVMLVCSFVHRMGTWKRGLVWTALSLGAAYLFTILVNGLRIVLAIYLPPALGKIYFSAGWLSPEGLHTAIGTAVYFLALIILYHLAGLAVKNAGHSILQPAFWYFVMVLGIPFVHRVLRNDYENFAQYAFSIIAVCAGAICLGRLAIRLVGFMKWLFLSFFGKSRKQELQKQSL